MKKLQVLVLISKPKTIFVLCPPIFLFLAFSVSLVVQKETFSHNLKLLLLRNCKWDLCYPSFFVDFPFLPDFESVFAPSFWKQLCGLSVKRKLSPAQYTNDWNEASTGLISFADRNSFDRGCSVRLSQLKIFVVLCDWIKKRLRQSMWHFLDLFPALRVGFLNMICLLLFSLTSAYLSICFLTCLRCSSYLFPLLYFLWFCISGHDEHSHLFIVFLVSFNCISKPEKCFNLGGHFLSNCHLFGYRRKNYSFPFLAWAPSSYSM